MKLVNKTGYLKGAKTVNNPVNIIPSNLITTQGMAFPIKANGKTLYPNTGQYKFPTSHVIETPLKQKGVNKLEGDLISKVVMNRNKDKDFVKRANAVGQYPNSNMFTRFDPNKFGQKNTHLMSWGEDDKGQTYMYPDIMNPNNEAVKVPNQYADYISSEGYKKATGMSYQKGALSISAKNKKQFADVAKQKPTSDDIPEIFNVPQKKLIQVLGGNGKESYSDLIYRKKNTKGNYINTINKSHPDLLNNIGFAGDIFVDPLNFVGGFIGKGLKGLANVSKTKKVAKTFNKLNMLFTGTNVSKDIVGAIDNYQKIPKMKKGSKGVSLAFSRGEKDPKGGLTQKGVDKYNRATGGNLKMAVTTPPSKLKAGSKPANRRKSFCARMSGVKGPMRKPNGEPSRKALALRKWNC